MREPSSCSPFFGEDLLVRAIIARRKSPPAECAAETRVVNIAAVEDPDFKSGPADAKAIIVVVAPVTDELFIEQSHRLNRAPGNVDADETDHPGLVTQSGFLRPLSPVSDVVACGSDDTVFGMLFGDPLHGRESARCLQQCVVVQQDYVVAIAAWMPMFTLREKMKGLTPFCQSTGS